MVFHWWKAVAQEKRGWHLPKPQIASRTCSPDAPPRSSPQSSRNCSQQQSTVFAHREITLKPLFHKHTLHLDHS